MNAYMNHIQTLLVCSNFCKINEPIIPYGISCLESAFCTSMLNAGDTLDVFTCDLNRFYNALSNDYSINWEFIADEIVTKVCIEKYNVVAFSVFGWFEKAVKIASSRLSKMRNAPFIVMGGSSIFGTEKELRSRFPEVNMFVLSYGEKIFANLRNYINSGNRCVLDLPKSECLKSPYLTGNIALGGAIDSVRVETRRGCLFRCSFCKHRDTISGRVYHIGNYERQVKELELFRDVNIRKLNVLDPLFNDYEDHGAKYLKLLRQVKFDGIVSLQIRPELLTNSFLEEAAQNSKLIFEIGVQSLQPSVLKTIQRGGERTESQLLDKLDRCRNFGIATEATLIYGLPLQTFESFERDVDLLRRYGVSKIEKFPLQVYPGTKLAEDIAKFNLRTEENAFGIQEVIDNPTHDFDKMKKFAIENEHLTPR